MTMNRFLKAPDARLAGYWLFVTAPSLVFFLTVLRDFLKSPQQPDPVFLFQSAAVFAGLTLAAAIAAWLLFGKKPWVEPAFLAAALALPIALIVLNSFGLTRTMDAQSYPTTCAVLYVPMFYALSGLGRFLRRPASAPVSLLIALFAPFFLAQAALALLTTFARVENDALPAILTLVTALLCLVFYYFYFRGLNAAYDALSEKRIAAVPLLVFGGLLPLLGLFGLLLTQGSLGGLPGLIPNGFLPRNLVSGFFIPLLFAPAAGVLLAIRPRGPGRSPLVLFILRLVLLPYSLYLLVAALPYLAFAPYLFMLLGMGSMFALVLGLCFFHARRLIDDYRYRKATVSPAAARVPLLILGLFPLLVTGVIVHDRTTLAAAYAYVTDARSDFPAPPVSGAALARINEFSGRDGWPNGLPVVGPLYNALVFEDKPISRETGELMAAVFMGKTPPAPSPERWNAGNPSWTARGETSFRPATLDYSSRVTLAMTNGPADKNEFVAAFTLPPGARVSGLRLEIGGRFREAIRVGKTTALFAYESIVRRQRDPAILYYAEGDEIRFRVFSFAPRETRRAEISLLHLAPFTLEIATGPGARRTVALEPAFGVGRNAWWRPSVIASPDNTLYLAPEYKRSLPLVARVPYFHFILDVSSGNPDRSRQYEAKVDDLLRRYPALAADARMSLVNAGVETYPAGSGWRGALGRARTKTGFCLERSLRTVYGDPGRTTSPRYPVVVVMSPDPARAIYRRSLADCREQFPEGDDYYWAEDETLKRRDLTVHPTLAGTRGSFADFRVRTVRTYSDAPDRIYYLRDDEHGALVFPAEDDPAVPPAAASPASPLFALFRAEHDAAVRPGRASPVPGDDPASRPETTLLARDSSFIVLETEEADMAVMKMDQNAEKGDKLFSMDEPDPLVWITIAAALLALGCAVRAFVRRNKNYG